MKPIYFDKTIKSLEKLQKIYEEEKKAKEEPFKSSITPFASGLMFCIGALISLALNSFMNTNYLTFMFSTLFLILFFWFMVVGLKGGFEWIIISVVEKNLRWIQLMVLFVEFQMEMVKKHSVIVANPKWKPNGKKKIPKEKII